MKTLIKSILPLALAAAFPVLAQQEEIASFKDADNNDNGVLNADEAAEALPGANINDANDDGVVSRGEAENSIAGLNLTPGNDGDDASAVDESDYHIIVQLLQHNAQAGN
ncbi:MAG: hypothetical protein R3F50_19100 [Gammaproteobacteria bacterium]